MFPHLIAGPIQRPSYVLPQVQAARVFDAERCYDGLQLIAMGLFRNVVIADNCAAQTIGADAERNDLLIVGNSLPTALGRALMPSLPILT